MKITKTEVEALRELIAPHDDKARRAAYARGDFARANRVRDLDRRYRWDLFWAVRGHNVLTGEYNDAHIDTALRAIIPPLD